MFEGVLAVILCLCASARSRSALLCTVIALAITWRPRMRHIALIVSVVIFVISIASVQVSINLGGYRSVSFAQYAANVSSFFKSDESATIDPSTRITTEWRIAWWQSILERSDGRGLFSGLGWGSNLANVFGFQTSSDPDGINALRNPHNLFLGVLARAGWISAIMLVAFYVSLFVGLMRINQRAAHGSVRTLAQLSGVYLIVCIINASTDVFLEGPQNAIPHWICIGLAWRLIGLHRAPPHTDRSLAITYAPRRPDRFEVALAPNR